MVRVGAGNGNFEKQIPPLTNICGSGHGTIDLAALAIVATKPVQIFNWHSTQFRAAFASVLQKSVTWPCERVVSFAYKANQSKEI